MANEPAHMWPYWRDKKGFEEALNDYYPELLKDNAVISINKVMIDGAKAAIEAEMARLAGTENDEDAD